MPARPRLTRNCREAGRRGLPGPHTCTGCECSCHHRPMPPLWFRQLVADARREAAARRQREAP